MECTKFDKLVLVFKDGHYQVVELPEQVPTPRPFPGTGVGLIDMEIIEGNECRARCVRP